MKKNWTVLVLLLTTIGLTTAALAQQRPPTTSGGSGMALLNLKDTVALHGYDPVSYFEGEPTPGSRRVLERVGGATYYFSSWGNRYTFLGDAPKYQPQFGGYCATSMAIGLAEDINPEVFTIYNGKLYLFKDDAARARFLSDPRGTIAAAEHNYFELAHRQRTFY